MFSVRLEACPVGFCRARPDDGRSDVACDVAVRTVRRWIDAGMVIGRPADRQRTRAPGRRRQPSGLHRGAFDHAEDVREVWGRD